MCATTTRLALKEEFKRREKDRNRLRERQEEKIKKQCLGGI